MSPQQLSFDLPARAAMGAADFAVSDCNRDAVAWLDRWPDWPGAILAIYGPAGCGKTHLAHVWQTRSAARFLDQGFSGRPPDGNLVLDGARLPEEDLFHLINHIRAAGHSLLILDREAPALPLNPRRSDDPYFRIQQQAEQRAQKNGHANPERAGREAMALRKLLESLQIEPVPETILLTVAGAFRRAA